MGRGPGVSKTEEVRAEAGWKKRPGCRAGEWTGLARPDSREEHGTGSLYPGRPIPAWRLQCPLEPLSTGCRGASEQPWAWKVHLRALRAGSSSLHQALALCPRVPSKKRCSECSKGTGHWLLQDSVWKYGSTRAIWSHS